MNSPTTKLHPLMATAAVSAILVSLLGAAALLGWLPKAGGDNTASTDVVMPAIEKPAAPPAAAAAPAEAAAPKIAATAPHRPAPHPTAPASRSGAPGHAPAPSPAGMPAVAQAEPPAPAVSRPAPVCEVCGKVAGVRTVDVEAKPSGVGVVAGAVVGGLLGNQVGGGTGRTLATVAGAVGGGYAGNEIEKRTRKAAAYEVDVVMDNRERMSFRFDAPPPWKAGDRVRVVNGTLAAR